MVFIKKSQDNTVQQVKLSENFLYRNFRNCEYYDRIIPSLNQRVQLYGKEKPYGKLKKTEISLKWKLLGPENSVR